MDKHRAPASGHRSPNRAVTEQRQTAHEFWTRRTWDRLGELSRRVQTGRPGVVGTRSGGGSCPGRTRIPEPNSGSNGSTAARHDGMLAGCRQNVYGRFQSGSGALRRARPRHRPGAPERVPAAQSAVVPGQRCAGEPKTWSCHGPVPKAQRPGLPERSTLRLGTRWGVNAEPSPIVPSDADVLPGSTEQH
jgi:hypothetical protein